MQRQESRGRSHRSKCHVVTCIQCNHNQVQLMWNIRPSLKKSEFCLRVLLHGQERSFSVPRMHLPNLSIAQSLSTLLWAASLLASSYFKLLRLVVCLFQLPLALPKRYLMAPTKWQQMKMTVCSPPSFPVRPQRVL